MGSTGIKLKLKPGRTYSLAASEVQSLGDSFEVESFDFEATAHNKKLQPK